VFGCCLPIPLGVVLLSATAVGLMRKSSSATRACAVRVIEP
jgi:hypothetical protein